jgi:hypothetical protein
MSENGKQVVNADGGKDSKVGKEQLKKRIQKHYDMSAEQFLKVWYGVPRSAHIYDQYVV